MSHRYWILLDCETDIPPGRVLPLSISWVRMDGWRQVGKMKNRFLNWGVDVQPEATAIHRLDRAYLEQHGQDPRSVLAELSADAASACIQGVSSYNWSFDGDTVLNPVMAEMGLPALKKLTCLYNVVRALLDPSPAGNHKLQVLRDHYGCPQRNAHGAEDDVLTTIDLLPMFRGLAQARGLRYFRDFVAFGNMVHFPLVIGFGKYKGRHVDTLRLDQEFLRYLAWLEDNANDQFFREAARHYRLRASA